MIQYNALSFQLSYRQLNLRYIGKNWGSSVDQLLLEEGTYGGDVMNISFFSVAVKDSKPRCLAYSRTSYSNHI